uniref:Uncharacterized protein n=1 Tax=Candidatus Methanogaster sp. ANME-2c ERB4 TaxID=2759911 RepID=A0A7G9Y7N2_9EURY|nr:hypothetical protein KOEAEPIB_00001 [Methanosarcinales archaeon ANME-2c ERB4]QNO44016.1 hypothetical protein FIDFODCG_00002 [Methanosarcinales archaeon ANME-2c ERB4]QNO44215.1 hypothetical protein EAPJJHLA_00006 [Methanosarcinales archaeon ANME-2c ERB4]QNO44794.1 hypothetical protein HJJCBNBL_00006 [Methanosarcinales archaeon ANME-2c ERB4]
MSFNLSDMVQGELCHDRCLCLLLADHMQDVGAVGLNAESRGAGHVLKCGVLVTYEWCNNDR